MLLDEASQGRPRWEEIVGVAVVLTQALELSSVEAVAGSAQSQQHPISLSQQQPLPLTRLQTVRQSLSQARTES
jgi:hypothetical protein